MKITATIITGREFGTSGKVMTTEKVFTSLVAWNKYLTMLREFDAEDEIVSVSWDCN